jgi:hypothetical protein
MTKPRLFQVTYLPPGQSDPVNIRVGFRGAELIVALRDLAASRFQMLQRGRPRIGLNAPSTVSTLSEKGFVFKKDRVDGEDESGNKTWWMKYQLRGQIVSIEPIQPKREVAG